MSETDVEALRAWLSANVKQQPDEDWDHFMNRRRAAADTYRQNPPPPSSKPPEYQPPPRNRAIKRSHRR